jgi:hypothetical protein
MAAQARLVTLQGQVGNRAVAALVARQPTPGLVAPPSAEGLARHLEPLLAAAPSMESDAELGDALAEAAVHAVGGGLDAAGKERVRLRAYEVLGRSRSAGDSTYNVHSALKALNDIQQAGNQDPEAPDVRVSYGLRLVTSMMAEHAAEHIIEAAVPSFTPGDTIAFIDDDLAVAVGALTDASSLLDLELEGTLNRLADVRAEFNTMTGAEFRAPLGAEIGRLARRALLIDRELTALGKAAPLDEQVGRMGARIAAIRSQAQDEEHAMKAMDSDLSLLGVTSTPVREPDYAPLAGTQILPEEAFPRATDAASDEFMDGLATRLEDQGEHLAALKDKVLPSNRTYQLDELARVHARWFAFFSAEQERRDMEMWAVWLILDKGWDVLGNAALPPHVGISAAIVRAQMLSQWSGVIGSVMGEATPEFGGELAAPQRVEPDVTGSARNPDYSFAEIQPRVRTDATGARVREMPAAETSERGEASSRADYVGDQQRRTSRDFSELARIKKATPGAELKEAVRRGIAPDEKPIVGLRTTEAQEGWSYLIDVRDRLTSGDDILAREHKVMPPEVVEYLAAIRQHSATRATTHRPMAGGRPIGEAAIRRGGVEAGEGTSARRYVEGQEAPAPSASATRLRATMKEADQRIGAGGSKSPTQLLIDELEAYLDEFFVANQTKAVRVAAIFVMAQREHNVGQQLMALLQPEVLKQLIGEAIKVSLIMSILQRMGAIGALAALAYQTYLKSQGVGNVAAFIGIATFMWEAGGTDDFDQARAFALFSKKIFSDAAELLEGLLSKPIEIGLGKITEKPPDGAREAGEAMQPLMKDPEARKQLLDGTDQKIEELRRSGAGKDRSDPELEAWLAFRSGLEQVSRPGDPGAEVELPGRTQGTTTAEAAFAPRGRSNPEVAAIRAGLGDLQGKVEIVQNPDPALRATVRVHYDGGKIRMEVGPEAGKKEVEQHYETAKILHRYQRPVGRILRLIERATSWLTGQPGYGTRAFEARLEVRKLRKMIDELEGEKLAIDARARRMSADPKLAEAEAKQIDARIADLEAQLEYHRDHMDSLEAGRGWVAAEDRRPRRPKGFETTQYKPSNLRVKPGTAEGLEHPPSSPAGRPQTRKVTPEEQIHGINLEWQKVRGATPTDALQKKAQADLPTGSPDPAFPGRVTDGPGQADHIVSVDRIRQMPGFAALDVKRQIEVLNLEVNFVALSPAANRSKGSLSFSEWKGHKGMGIDADPKWLEQMAKREQDLVPVLEGKINELLRAQMTEEQWAGGDPGTAP